MTITVDMTVLAVLALVASIAAFIAPRFLGIMAGVALFIFAVVHLFPQVRDVDLGKTLSAIDLDDVRIEEPVSTSDGTGEPG